jgi:hypothetical protein
MMLVISQQICDAVRQLMFGGGFKSDDTLRFTCVILIKGNYFHYIKDMNLSCGIITAKKAGAVRARGASEISHDTPHASDGHSDDQLRPQNTGYDWRNKVTDTASGGYCWCIVVS